MKIDHPSPTDAARSYTGRGWHIFPAPVGTKQSFISHKTDPQGRKWGATSDPAEAAGYFQRWSDANVAIVTGSLSGIFVIDIDTPEGHDVDGFDSLAQLQATHGALPVTLIAQSPSGSRHLYFNWPAAGNIRNSVGKIAAGIDVRGDGGMVIAPPSVKPNGAAYFWVNPGTPLADAPAWLLEMVTRVSTEKPAARAVPASLQEVEELLSHVDPDANGYDGWQTVLASIHDASGGSDDGLNLADMWSSRGAMYVPGEVVAKWSSFTAGQSGGSTVATIAGMAKDAGADVVGIGARHRIMKTIDASALPPVTLMPGMSGPTLMPGMSAPVVPPTAAELILDRLQADPTTAVSVLAEEVARLPIAEREMVLAACTAFGIKTPMTAAVKRVIAAHVAETGADDYRQTVETHLANYIIVENENGSPVAMDVRGNSVPQTRIAFRDAKAGLDAVMITDPATGNIRAKPAADHWWEHPDTDRYFTTNYDPLADVVSFDKEGRRLRNIYTTGHIAPAMPVRDEGAIYPFLHVLRCNFPDVDDQNLLLQILGHMVQRPGELLRWSPVIQGTQGCGKGTIAEAVAYAHGAHNVSYPSPDVIARDFNEYMNRCTLVVVNEIGDHTKRELSALSEKLKPWISDSVVHIEPKGKRGFKADNHCNWIFTTNHQHCMLATTGERRYAHFISVLQTEAQAAIAFPDGWWTGAEGDWWSSYYQWWREGGADAVRGFLSHMQLLHLPSRAPHTTTTEQAMSAGDGMALGLIREAIAENAVGFRGGFLSVNAIRDLCEGDDVKIPAGPFLTRQLEVLDYVHVFRGMTSPDEARRFLNTARRTRIYHNGTDARMHDEMDPAQMVALYDAAQRRDGGDTPRGNILKMPGVT